MSEQDETRVDHQALTDDLKRWEDANGVTVLREQLVSCRAEITALHGRNHILGVALLWYVDEPNGHIAAQGLREAQRVARVEE